jgi:hypothetical protein
MMLVMMIAMLGQPQPLESPQAIKLHPKATIGMVATPFSETYQTWLVEREEPEAIVRRGRRWYRRYTPQRRVVRPRVFRRGACST